MLLRKRRWRVGLLLAICSGTAGIALPMIQSQPVFRIKMVHLFGCPDSLRTPIANIVAPLIDRSLHEASGQRAAIVSQLKRLPEVADAKVVCRAPNAVDVRLTPRLATYTLKADGHWLALEATGRILRVDAQPVKGLVQLFGLDAGDGKPGTLLRLGSLEPAKQCVEACTTVLGGQPVSIEIGSGGALRIRTEHGDQVVLGEASDLHHKLTVFASLRGKLSAPARYVDVSAPNAPVSLPEAVQSASADTAAAGAAARG